MYLDDQSLIYLSMQTSITPCLSYKKLKYFDASEQAVTGTVIQPVMLRCFSHERTAKTGPVPSRNPSNVPGLSSAIYNIPAGSM